MDSKGSTLEKKRQSHDFDPEGKEVERPSLKSSIIRKARATRLNIHSYREERGRAAVMLPSLSSSGDGEQTTHASFRS